MLLIHKAPQILLLTVLLVLVSVVLDVITLQVTVEPVAEDGTVDKVLILMVLEMMMAVAEVDLVTFILPLLLLTILKAVS
mgnify:CR=1 FL=1